MIEIQFPLNSIAWAVGSLTLGVFALKNWLRYRKGRNYLNLNLAWFGATLGLGLALTSYAEFFTTDVSILHAFNLTSEIVISLAFIIKSRLLWHLVLKGRMPYWTILLPLIGIAIWGWLGNLYGSTTSLREPFVDFRYAPEGVIAQNIFLAGIIIPIGLTFLIKGIKELIRTKAIRPFFKPFLIGITYIGIAASTINSNFDSGGLETVGSTYGNIALFLVLLAVLLLPPLKKTRK